mgnify:CR=1 FL=1
MYYGEDAEFIIESQEGKGTTIVIRIPKTQGREKDENRNRRGWDTVREGLMKLLERIDQNYQVVGEAENGKGGW